MTAFEALGIGVEGIREHDFGMDVFLHGRNAAFVDLGVFATAQIKSGTSYFREPVTGSDGRESGWWFRSDEEHLDYWRQSSLAHLVVLHNPVTEEIFWQRIRPGEVERTGVDWRVQVPAQQALTPDQHSELIKAIAEEQRFPTFEGTAW